MSVSAALALIPGYRFDHRSIMNDMRCYVRRVATNDVTQSVTAVQTKDAASDTDLSVSYVQ